MARKRTPRSITGQSTYQNKFAKVMREFEAGTLTSRGKKVTGRDQAMAIADSEGRRAVLEKRKRSRGR